MSNVEKSNSCHRIVRSRAISSCKKCYKSKRKCDKEKPFCRRCLNSNIKCEYFTAEQLEDRVIKRKNLPFNNELTIFIENSTIVPDPPNSELSPQPRQLENVNFKLIVNSTDEYSKYFSMGLFPFNDHAANVSWVINCYNIKSEKVVVFDFSSLVKPLSTIRELRSKIPKRETSDNLVKHFFNYIYPYIPIVDKEEFFFKYEEFWTNPNKCNDLNTLILMFALYFCSSSSLLLNQIYNNVHNKDIFQNKELFDKINENVDRTDNDDKLNYDTLRKNSFLCIENLKYMLNTSLTPSLSSLIALTLIYYVGSMNCHTTTSEIAMLVKYCQTFGLHRNISGTKKGTPLRNIIYSFIWYIDTLNSYYIGLPPNMNQEYFESENNFPEDLTNLDILFFLSRLHNSNFWSHVISAINKINKTTIIEYQNMQSLYLESLNKVTKLNNQILNWKGKEADFLKWLVSETRLGMRKSALLMNVLEYSICFSSGERKSADNMNTELVLQSMLLINESIMKIVLGLKFRKESLWYIRCSYPFQAMYIVMSHIQKLPNMALNFSILDNQIEYTTYAYLKINYLDGDIRKSLIDESFEALSLILPFWPGVFKERFDRILKFKNFVFDKMQNETNEINSKNLLAIPGNYHNEINHKIVSNSPGLNETADEFSSTLDFNKISKSTYSDDGFNFYFDNEFDDENTLSKNYERQMNKIFEMLKE